MYEDKNMPVPGYHADDHVCMYCGKYQSDPEHRPTAHISWDLAVTHRLFEKASPADGRRDGFKDDVYDLLCELTTAYAREGK